MRAAAVMIVLALVLAACTTSANQSAPTTTPTTTPSPTEAGVATPTQVSPAPTTEPTAQESTPVPTAEPTLPDNELPSADLNDKEAAGFPDPAGETAFLDSVGIGDHPDYERVVFRFTEGSVIPSWRVAYAQEITESGSGNPVTIAGEMFLSVILSGASGVDLSGEEFETVYTGPKEFAGADAGARTVRQVVQAGDFEGSMDWGIGLDSERPFRVFTLEDPSRVVIDVLTN